MADSYEDHKDYMRTGGLLRDALASAISLKQNFCTPAELAEEVLQTIGDAGYVVAKADEATAARLSRLNKQRTLSPRPWRLIWDEAPAKKPNGEPAGVMAPVAASVRIVDADQRLLVRVQADPEQTLKVEDMQLIVEAVNALAGAGRMADRPGDPDAALVDTALYAGLRLATHADAVKVAALIDEGREALDRIEARLSALQAAITRINTTQVYECPGVPARGLNVEFVAALSDARRLVQTQTEEAADG